MNLLLLPTPPPSFTNILHFVGSVEEMYGVKVAEGRK